MSALSLDISGISSIDAIISDFRATERQSLVATTRALNKTALWLKSQSVRDIAKNKRIPQKLIRERISLLRASRNKLQATMRASVRGIRPEKLGSLRQTQKGVRVKSFSFDGAFIAKMPSNKHASIYKRKSKARLPVQAQTIPIADEANKSIENILDGRINKRFTEIFRQELNYVVNR